MSGWKQAGDSLIVSLSEKIYKKSFAKKLLVDAIHAGLECGLITSKYPQLESISVGPTIQNAHTSNERVEVISIDRIYKFLKKMLTSFK